MKVRLPLLPGAITTPLRSGWLSAMPPSMTATMTSLLPAVNSSQTGRTLMSMPFLKALPSDPSFSRFHWMG